LMLWMFGQRERRLEAGGQRSEVRGSKVGDSLPFVTDVLSFESEARVSEESPR
jgi:hypothetical protein